MGAKLGLKSEVHKHTLGDSVIARIALQALRMHAVQPPSQHHTIVN